MKIKLKNYTPLWICADGIRTCWDSHDKSDTKSSSVYTTKGIPTGNVIITGEKDKALIERVGNKNKHSSTLEHLYYNFSIDGISRACLQELARHRMASLSVKSTRYTLKELKEEAPFIYLYVDNEGVPSIASIDGAIERAKKYVIEVDNRIDISILYSLHTISKHLKRGDSNDKVKYLLPEAYKTSLAWSINARSLQNFLALRTSKAALWEIRELANEIFNKLPEDHKYLFEDSIYKGEIK